MSEIREEKTAEEIGDYLRNLNTQLARHKSTEYSVVVQKRKEKWVPLDYHEAEIGEWKYLFIRVLEEVCYYEKMMETKVKDQERQIELMRQTISDLIEKKQSAKSLVVYFEGQIADIIEVIDKFPTESADFVSTSIISASVYIHEIKEWLEQLRSKLALQSTPGSEGQKH